MSTRGRRLPVNSAAHSLLPQRASTPNSRVRGRTTAVYVRGHFRVAFSRLLPDFLSFFVIYSIRVLDKCATGKPTVHEAIFKNWIKRALALPPARLALPNNNCRLHKLCFVKLYLSLSMQKLLDADKNWWQIERKSCFGLHLFIYFWVL